MKRLWIGVGIMTAVLALLIWGNVTITNACEDMSDVLNAIIAADEADDEAAIQENAQALLQAWEHYHTRLSALKNHQDLDDLMTNINLIADCAAEGEREELTETCKDSLVRLEHMKDGEKISFGNVF